jgi:hypothetical protein
VSTGISFALRIRLEASSCVCFFQTLRWYVLVLGVMDDSDERRNVAVSASFTDACVSTIGAGSGPQEQWTLMVYIAADSDLAYFALLDLYEMLEAPRTEDLKIVALVDLADSDKSSFFTPPKMRVCLLTNASYRSMAKQGLLDWRCCDVAG